MSSNLLGNSSMPNYIKLMAGGILTMTYIAALGVAMRDYLGGIPVPVDISGILFTGLGMALTALGFHQGASVTEQVVPLPSTTTTTSTTVKSIGGPNDASTPAT